ncbi:hypothetical protein HLI18_20315 [Rhizobium laguerreae]|uniref:DUF6894 family protein n=1 Tax=Rhizobium laguerreae TaxID=1076926 RepID=UPI00147890DD|nr:hypothetical protein [Rhizobium laguerreae]NNG72169.1 hypothetical protein [Rhizobium laguerreae]
MLTLYFHITHMDGSVLDTEGREFPDLFVAIEAARERLQEIVATALLSRKQRIPLGIAICGKEGTILREVAVDAAITEIARSHQPSSSSFLGTSAGSGTNSFSESKGPGRAEASLTPRPFAASVRLTPSVENY